MRETTINKTSPHRVKLLIEERFEALIFFLNVINHDRENSRYQEISL